MSNSRRIITVIVAEDHPVTRAGLRSALEEQERLRVVAEAGSGEEALLLAKELKPDVLVLDVELPGMDGLEVAELLRQELPGSKVILLSMHDRSYYVERATLSGVCGYLLKSMPVANLVQCVLTVGLNRDKRMEAESDPVESALTPANEPPRLNERDEKLLRMLANGMSNREIAAELGIAVKTVASYRQTLKRRLNIGSLAGLTRYAIKIGLVKTPAEENL